MNAVHLMALFGHSPSRKTFQGQLCNTFLTFFHFLQGLNFLIPVLDRIRYVQSLKEIVIDVPEQSAVSLGQTPSPGPAPSAFLFP